MCIYKSIQRINRNASLHILFTVFGCFQSTERWLFMHHLFTCVDNREHRCTSPSCWVSTHVRYKIYTFIFIYKKIWHDWLTSWLAMQSATGTLRRLYACVFHQSIHNESLKRIPFKTFYAYIRKHIRQPGTYAYLEWMIFLSNFKISSKCMFNFFLNFGKKNCLFWIGENIIWSDIFV